MGPGSEDIVGDEFTAPFSSPIEQDNKQTSEAYVESSKISQPLVRGWPPTSKAAQDASHKHSAKSKSAGQPKSLKYPTHNIDYPTPPKPRVHFSKPIGSERQFSAPEEKDDENMDERQTGDRNDGKAKTPGTNYQSQNSYGQKIPHHEDPEKIRLEAEIKAFKAAEEKVKQSERQRELEAMIRKDAEEGFYQRMEAMRVAQEEAKKEIEKVREEAERSVIEQIQNDQLEEDKRTAEMKAYRALIEDDLKKRLDRERLLELEKWDSSNKQLQGFEDLVKATMLKGIEDIIGLTKEKLKLELEKEREMATERQAERKQLIFEIREELKTERNWICGQCPSMESAAPESQTRPLPSQDYRKYLIASSSATASSPRQQTDDWSVQMDPAWLLGQSSATEPPGTPDSSFGYETARESSTDSSDETTSSSMVDSTTRNDLTWYERDKKVIETNNNITEIEDSVNKIVDAFVRRLTGPICWDVGDSPAPQHRHYQERYSFKHRPYISEFSSPFSESSYDETDDESIFLARSRQRRKLVRPMSSNYGPNSHRKRWRVKRNKMRSRSNITPSAEIEEATQHSGDPTPTECDLPPAPEPPSSLNGTMGTETTDYTTSNAETSMAYADSDLEYGIHNSPVLESRLHEGASLSSANSAISLTNSAPQYLIEDAASQDRNLDGGSLIQPGVELAKRNIETGLLKTAETVTSEACSHSDGNNDKHRERRFQASIRSRSCSDPRSKEPLVLQNHSGPLEDKELQLAALRPSALNPWPQSFIGRPMLLTYKQTANVLDLAIPRNTSQAKRATSYANGNIDLIREAEIEWVD